MDFFKSILADDSEPEESPDNLEESEINPTTNPSPQNQEFNTADNDPNSSPNSSENEGGGGVGGGIWSFGGLVNTLTSRSESVLETYRRDLKEFGSGLKKETDLFREVASRAVKELPASIEVGASAIDGVLKSTAEMISHGKDSLLAATDLESDSSTEKHNYIDQGSGSRRFSRFDSQLIAIQRDTRTYSEEPEDSDDFNKWKLGFVLEDKRLEIENLIGDNGSLGEMYRSVVPNDVDQVTFWCRYFYRVHKLKQQEDMRAKLVKRSLSADVEEELTWDVDDDEEEEEAANVSSEANTLGHKDPAQIAKNETPKDESKTKSSEVDELKTASSGVVDENVEKKANVTSVDKDNVVEPSGDSVSEEKVELVGKSQEKVENGESCKLSDISIVSTRPSLQEEEDLGWDEIEDLGSSDEKQVSKGESPNKSELRKQLSAAEEDEDLSWDIEDDDEPLKA